MNRLFFALVAILAVVIGLLVGTLNSDAVRLDLLWVQLDWPLGLLMLIALALGLLLGMMLVYFSRVFPLRLRMRKLQAESERLKSQAVTSIDD